MVPVILYRDLVLLSVSSLCTEVLPMILWEKHCSWFAHNNSIRLSKLGLSSVDMSFGRWIMYTFKFLLYPML